jgi:hypothetical protein
VLKIECRQLVKCGESNKFLDIFAAAKIKHDPKSFGDNQQMKLIEVLVKSQTMWMLES